MTEDVDWTKPWPDAIRFAGFTLRRLPTGAWLHYAGPCGLGTVAIRVEAGLVEAGLVEAYAQGAGGVEVKVVADTLASAAQKLAMAGLVLRAITRRVLGDD